MSPPVAKQNIRTSGRGNSRKQEDTFEEFDAGEYRHMTGDKPSIFSKLFTKIGLHKTAKQCGRCWDDLRMINFQVAGDWYLNLRYQRDKPWGRSDISEAAIRQELRTDWKYLRTPLTECLHLGPLEAAARYVWFLVHEEGQDPKSFIHGLGENKLTFVIHLFLNCKFGPDTHKHPLTKMLFPLTRNGDWRRKHLSSSRSTKRGGASISDHNKDDKEGSGITESPSKRIRASYFPRGSRHSSDQKSTENIVNFTSSTSVCPSGETVVKTENRDLLSSTDASSQKTPTGTTEPSIFEPSATSPPQPDSRVQTPNAASLPTETAQELSAHTISPFSPQTPHHAASAEPGLTGSHATPAIAEAARLKRRNAELEEEARDREVTVSQLRRRVSEQEAEIQKQEQKVIDLKAFYKEGNDWMAARDEEIIKLSGRIAQDGQALLEKDQEITKLEKAVAEVGELASSLQKESALKDLKINEQSYEITVRTQFMATAIKKLADLPGQVEEQIHKTVGPAKGS